MTYSYAELKGKIYTHEEFLKIAKKGMKIIVFPCGNNVDKYECEVSSIFFWDVPSNLYQIIEEPVTWENLGTDPSREDFVLYGDVKRKVLGRLNNIVFLSQISNLDCIGNFLTIIELKEKNYTIVQPEPETPKPTREKILAKLTQEERDIIEGK